MKEQVFFLNMFSDYEPPEELHNALSQAAIVAADIDMEQRSVSVAIHSPLYIPKRLLKTVSKDISESYGLRRLDLVATHPADQLAKIEPEELRDLFVEEDPMARGSLAGAVWQWNEDSLTIYLVANGKDALCKSVPAVQHDLWERFGVAVTITVVAGNALEGQALLDEMEKMRQNTLMDLPVAAVAQKKKSQAAAPAPEAFYGKVFRGQVTAMKDLNLDMGSVIVEGRVFAVDHKELKKRNAWVISFDMTDNTGSVRVNRFMEASEAKPILENVKAGKVLKIQGKLELNRYDSELVLKPFAMMPGSLP